MAPDMPGIRASLGSRGYDEADGAQRNQSLEFRLCTVAACYRPASPGTLSHHHIILERPPVDAPLSTPNFNALILGQDGGRALERCRDTDGATSEYCPALRLALQNNFKVLHKSLPEL